MITPKPPKRKPNLLVPPSRPRTPMSGKPKPTGKIHAPRPVGGNPKRITRPKAR